MTSPEFVPLNIEELIVPPNDPTPEEAGLPPENVTAEEDRVAYQGSTYDIVSRVAYLIGVPKRFFTNERDMLKATVYNWLELDKSARIVRHLCIIRTAIELNFKNINDRMRMNYTTVLNMPEYVPKDSLQQLSIDGVSFVKRSSTKLCHHIIELNRLISDRINNCQGLFPLWLKWEYIRELFVMPDGLKETGTKLAADLYYAHKYWYPYKMYINWMPQNVGNILYNDKKFITLLYQWHNDYFSEHSKVSDAGSHIKGSIYDFIDASGKVVVVVDCENSDPYKLCATIRSLGGRATQKITSIILFDDVHTASAWKILESYTSIPVEHILIERVKQNKSLVDIMLTTRTCQEHYKNNVDSFILVSSDSDYWGLISSLPEARFLVMLERESCGQDLKNALANTGITYCYIDDFYSGNTAEMKHRAIFRAMYHYIESCVRLNIYQMFNEALRVTRVEMNLQEKKQFMSKYIQTMQMSIDDDGNVVLDFKRK